MEYGIIAALDEEIKLLKSCVENIQEVQLYGYIFYKGVYMGKNMVFVKCSVGKVNAALCTTLLIREFDPQYVINVGIAGNMDKDLNVLGVCIGQTVAFHDTDEIMTKYHPFTQTFMADKSLVQNAVNALESLNTGLYKVGLIATGDEFVSSKTSKEKIKAQLNPVCVEMEGAAIGEVATIMGKPFLVIRTMSDNADEEASEVYDNFIEQSAEKSVKILLEMVNN